MRQRLPAAKDGHTGSAAKVHRPLFFRLGDLVEDGVHGGLSETGTSEVVGLRANIQGVNKGTAKWGADQMEIGLANRRHVLPRGVLWRYQAPDGGVIIEPDAPVLQAPKGSVGVASIGLGGDAQYL